MDFLIDFFMVICWHLLILLLTRCLPITFFNPTKKMYQTAKWELGGKFYTKKLKIKKWKDRLPQYIAKNGFSKRNLESIKNDPSYIERFVIETCRAEWNHTLCCAYCILSFVLSHSAVNASVISLITLAANLPYILIQRYNRIRLQKLRNENR